MGAGCIITDYNYYKKLSSLSLLCYMTGLILCFCDIRHTDMNLDDIKNNEHLNLLLSCLADLLGFIPFIIHKRTMKSKKVGKNPKRKKKNQQKKSTVRINTQRTGISKQWFINIYNIK